MASVGRYAVNNPEFDQFFKTYHTEVEKFKGDLNDKTFDRGVNAKTFVRNAIANFRQKVSGEIPQCCLASIKSMAILSFHGRTL